MANIASPLNTIKNAIYGKDMRNAIHDSVKTVNDDINDHKSSTVLDHPNGCVTTEKIAHRSIERNKIKMKAVGTDELDDKVIVTRHIGDKQVTTAKLADKCITNYQLNNNAVATYAIEDGAITKEKLADELVDELTEQPVAGVGKLGCVKIYGLSDGTNRSGLSVSSDGTIYVAAKNGLSRDGVGGLGINPATPAEVDDGIEGYKPVTPKTLKSFSENCLKSEYVMDTDYYSAWSLSELFSSVSLWDSFEERGVSNGKIVLITNDTAVDFYSSEPRNIASNQFPPASVGGDEIAYRIYGITNRLLKGHSYFVFFDSKPFRPSSGDPYTLGELIVIADVTEMFVTTDKIGDGAVTNTKLGNRAVSTDKIEDNAITVNKLADNVKYDTYSTTPQRIGTWIDGTPIWRVVIQQSISEEDRIGKSVSISLPVRNQTKPFIINDCMRLIYDNDCIVDDYKLPNFTAGCYDLPDWITTRTEYDKISGWIEFVTPESNIDQCYTGAWTESLNHKSSLNSVQSMYTSYSTNSNVSYNQYGPSQTACMQVIGGSSTAATGIKLDISDLFSDGDWIRAEFKIQVTGSPDTIQAFVTDNNQKIVLAKRGSGSMPIGEWINYTTDAAKVVSENGKIYFCVSNTCGYWYITDIVLYKLSA